MKALFRCCVALGTVLAPMSAQAIFPHTPLRSPVKAGEVGEIIFQRSDWSANHSEHVRMDREEFLRFFKEGAFRNDGNTLELVYRSDHFPKPLNEKGGWRYCHGAFATKNGRVFFWNRPREGVLEIRDNQYRTGWLILPKYMKQEGKKEGTPEPPRQP